LPGAETAPAKPQDEERRALPEVLRRAKGGAEQQKVAYDTARSIEKFGATKTVRYGRAKVGCQIRSCDARGGFNQPSLLRTTPKLSP